MVWSWSSAATRETSWPPKSNSKITPKIFLHFPNMMKGIHNPQQHFLINVHTLHSHSSLHIQFAFSHKNFVLKSPLPSFLVSLSVKPSTESWPGKQSHGWFSGCGSGGPMARCEQCPLGGHSGDSCPSVAQVFVKHTSGQRWAWLVEG